MGRFLAIFQIVDKLYLHKTTWRSFNKKVNFYFMKLFNFISKLSAVRKVLETLRFKHSGVLKLQVQNKLNTGCGLCQKDKFSQNRQILGELPILTLSADALCILISHGTSSKFADVRTHLRKVSEKMLNEKNFFNTFRCSDSCRQGNKKAFQMMALHPNNGTREKTSYATSFLYSTGDWSFNLC